MDCPVTARPTVIVISDSLGDTACEVVLAASGQFDEGAFRLLRLPKVPFHWRGGCRRPWTAHTRLQEQSR